MTDEDDYYDFTDFDEDTPEDDFSDEEEEN